MRIERLGLAHLKGTRHESLPAVDLTPTGPRGDRELCLLDPALGAVVRTAWHPELMRLRVREDDSGLALELPGGTVHGRPEPTGQSAVADYWGRSEQVEVLDSPHAGALSGFLGRRVELARVRRPGGVVYGAAVTLVTRADLDELGRRAGVADLAGQSARFRATLTLDDREHPLPPDATGTLRVGTTLLELAGPIPRCTLIERDPSTGRKDVDLLRALTGYRHSAGELWFGHYARVLAPGGCRVGDDVHWGA